LEHNFISWNLENWVTILLMVALGYGVLALMTKFLAGGAGGVSGWLPKFGGG
jgi:hypothetical protein